MEKRVVLITGCSSGIGLGLAVLLASDACQRFKVYATMRDLSKKEHLLECVRDCHIDTFEILQMDVTDQQSVVATIESIKEQRVDILDVESGRLTGQLTARENLLVVSILKTLFHLMKEGRISIMLIENCPSLLTVQHCIVCNAGVGLMGPIECHTYETMKKIFDVNLFGTISTIQAFLPGMKQRKSGRIIISSSVGGLQGIPFNDVYCASKFAVEGFCESLAIILQHFNIHVSLIECGPVSTSFMNNLQGCDLSDSCLQNVDSDTRSLYAQYLQHCQTIFQDVAQDTEEILQVFLEAIEAPVPSLRYFTTQFFMPLIKLKLSCAGGSEYVRAMHKFVFSEAKPKEAERQ